MKKWTFIIALVLAVTTFLTACGGSDTTENAETNSADKPKEQVLNLVESAELPSMDTTQADDNVSFNVMNNVFEGLYRLGKDNNPVPGAAESFDVSEDGKVYTFHLREGAVWSNGDAITAENFVYAWRKVLHPDSLSPYAYIMNDLKNAKAIQDIDHELYGKVEELGVNAIDDKTLEVELENAVPYFLGLTTFPTFFPQNESFVTEQGDNYSLEVENMVYNGPFVMSEWNQGEGFVLSKNDTYWEKDAVKLDKVNYKIVKDTSTRVNLYETGTIDRATLSAEYVDQFSTSPEFGTQEEPTLFFFRLNQENEFLTNVDIRKAIQMGWNKQALTDVILNNGSMPANYLVPKGFTFDSEGKDFREANPELATTNIEKAQEHWATGKATLGVDSVEIELLNFDTESSKKVGEYIKNQLETNLDGLTISIKQQPFKQKLVLETNHDYDMSFSGWGPDYQDPMTFLDLFVTDAGNNNMSYSNEAYDAIIASAKADLTDLDARWASLQEAERILVEEDAAIAPMFQRGSSFLQKTYVKDLVIHPFGPETSLKWTYIE